MAIKASELIEKLKEKEQDAMVEFIVAKTDGELVCADVAKTAKDMGKVLKMLSK